MEATDALNNLTKAVADWVTAVLPRLGPEQRAVFDAMLAGHCDVAVEVRLRKGTVSLRAIDEVQASTTVLHSVEVGPLREWNQ